MSKLTRVIGIGSRYGEDRAGWLVAARLARLPEIEAEVITVLQPIDMVEHVADCGRLIVVDAAVCESAAGGVRRFRWPDEAIEFATCHSSHGLGVAYALQLIGQMGRLPEEVICYAVVCGSPAAANDPVNLGDHVLWQIHDAARQIIEEIETNAERPRGA